MRRASDDTLLLGLSLSHREPARPVNIFAPFSLDVDAGSCPIETLASCPEDSQDGWRQGQYLVVANGENDVRIPAGSEQVVADTIVRVAVAEDGATGSCCFDCGDAAMLSFMLEAANGS